MVADGPEGVKVESVRRAAVPLIAIVLLGASLRLLYVQTPLLDAHRWRQVDTAAIARNFYEGDLNLFYPRVDWGGPDGYVETEFPLMPWLTALLYRAFGEHDVFGRLVSIVFSTATIVLLYALARLLLGSTGGGLAAAFLLAVSPAAAYFGRTFMPDAAMLFFWVAGVLGFVRYLATGSRAALWWGSAATALACLVKIPALMMFAPILGAVWAAKRFEMWRDRALLAALLLPLLVVTAWYWHAYTLYRDTGLTFGILVHPAKTYPPTVAPGPWISTFSKWSTIDLLSSREFYETLLGRLHHFYLLPWGLAGALLGLVAWRNAHARLVADMWVLALIVFVLVAGQGNFSHDYYQLPIVPAGALYFGAVAAPLFDLERVRTVWRARLWAACLGLVGVIGFHYSGIVGSHFRPESLDMRVMQAGQAVEQAVPPEKLLIVVDDYGVTSPLLFYFAKRKGWSFDVENLSPEVIQGLRGRGASYFVTTAWPRIVEERPEAAAYLQLHREVQLAGAPPGSIAFDLGTGP